MSEVMELKNAIITKAEIKLEREVFLVANIHLDYGGSGQMFGGVVLHNTNHKDYDLQKSKGYAGHYISKILEVLEVESWNDLIGKAIRVQATHTKVSGIGNIVKDKWFFPETMFPTT